MIARCNTIDFFGGHIQETDIRAFANLAGNTNTTLNRNQLTTAANTDTPAEKELNLMIVANGKLVSILKKKWPFFRKKQVETVKVNLLFIGLNLGKIRVVGHIQRQAGCD